MHVNFNKHHFNANIQLLEHKIKIETTHMLAHGNSTMYRTPAIYAFVD